MGGLGLALLNFGGSGIRMRISAFIFETGALALVVYAYAMFWHRANRLRRGERGSWDDRTVPVLVVIFFIFATAINFGLTFHKKVYTPPVENLFLHFNTLHFSAGDGLSTLHMNANASIIAVQGHRGNEQDNGLSFEPSNQRNQSTYGSIPSALRTNQSNKRIAVPVRVEPKVFFANERTFLSWLNFAIVLGSLALGLLNFGDKTGKIAGAAFTVIAMFVMVYALMLFQWRAERIRRRDAGPYDDRRGPVVLVVVLISAILVNFYLRFVYSS
ncbi:hypothetical protein H4R24_000628 [Coemansia sp. RSA 988]|nr:hypothetical protein H4R24_000628 [Coemansia sp. RSA 988]